MHNTDNDFLHLSPLLSTKIPAQVTLALAEDVGAEDLTARLIDALTPATAHIICREPAVICGIPWVNEVFKQVDQQSQLEWLVAEGECVLANQTLCKITGLARSLLTSERVALNFLQTLSATATATKTFVDKISGTNARILDTRKTIPTMRLAQKYAVTVGGGLNQRMGLYDGILIKENHIAAANGIVAALTAAFEIKAKQPNISIQIEVEDLTQLEQAIAAGASSVLLDNFNLDLLVKAVKLNNKRTLLEASGGISLENVRAIAETGVDRISIGSITKHIQAVDLSMRFTG